MAKKKIGKDRECVAFGAKVRDLRKEMGLTQEKFAYKVKLHPTYVAGIEAGLRNPTLMTIHKLAKGLKVTPAELLN